MTPRALGSLALLCNLFIVDHPAFGQPPPDETDRDLDGMPGVAAPPENPLPAAPSALAGVGSIVVDHSHRNDFDVSGFTDYLVSQGWNVVEHPVGPIWRGVLRGHDILVIPTSSSAGGTNPFTQPEIDAIQEFLSEGNGLWMLSDNQDPSGFNTLSSLFGVTFRYDYIRDPTNNEGEVFWPTIHELVSHEIASGVSSFGYFGGCCVTVNAPATVLATADEDAWSLNCPVGSHPPVLAVWEGAGRAVFVGDETPLHPTYYPERLRAEEQLLLQNIVNWLLGPPPSATSSASWGRIKAAYSGIDSKDAPNR